MSFVYALDFDGVICDSAGESSITALLAAKAKWPHLDLPSSPTASFPEPLINSLKKVRPVIETGFENVLLGRLVAETPLDKLDELFDQPVLHDWQSVRERVMEEWDVGKEEMIDVFGKVRDEWIERDIDSWVSANRAYPDIVHAINNSASPVYVITTKQKRFASLLLSQFGVTNIPEDNIYGLGMGTKIAVLKEIVAMPQHKGKQVLFVEDRFETLEKVSISMLGQPLQLFLGTWGYNTPKVREVAENHPFVQLVDLKTFVDNFQ